MSKDELLVVETLLTFERCLNKELEKVRLEGDKNGHASLALFRLRDRFHKEVRLTRPHSLVDPEPTDTTTDDDDFWLSKGKKRSQTKTPTNQDPGAT